MESNFVRKNFGLLPHSATVGLFGLDTEPLEGDKISSSNFSQFSISFLCLQGALKDGSMIKL